MPPRKVTPQVTDQTEQLPLPLVSENESVSVKIVEQPYEEEPALSEATRREIEAGRKSIGLG